MSTNVVMSQLREKKQRVFYFSFHFHIILVLCASFKDMLCLGIMISIEDLASDYEISLSHNDLIYTVTNHNYCDTEIITMTFMSKVP